MFLVYVFFIAAVVLFFISVCKRFGGYYFLGALLAFVLGISTFLSISYAEERGKRTALLESGHYYELSKDEVYEMSQREKDECIKTLQFLGDTKYYKEIEK